MKLPSQYQKWCDTAADYLVSTYKIYRPFAGQVAILLLYLFANGMNPRITSGYRSEEKQKELARRYAAGDRSIVVKPAEKSQHSTTHFGMPAARAIDIQTNNHSYAAMIARALNITAGIDFRTPDPVHFQYAERG